MTFKPAKCKVKLGYNKLWFGYDYHLARSKLHETSCEMDFWVNVMPVLSLEHYIRTVYEMDYLPANVKISLKCRNKMNSEKIYSIYQTQLRGCNVSLVTSLG